MGCMMSKPKKGRHIRKKRRHKSNSKISLVSPVSSSALLDIVANQRQQLRSLNKDFDNKIVKSRDEMMIEPKEPFPDFQLALTDLQSLGDEQQQKDIQQQKIDIQSLQQILQQFPSNKSKKNVSEKTKSFVVKSDSIRKAKKTPSQIVQIKFEDFPTYETSDTECRLKGKLFSNSLEKIDNKKQTENLILDKVDVKSQISACKSTKPNNRSLDNSNSTKPNTNLRAKSKLLVENILIMKSGGVNMLVKRNAKSLIEKSKNVSKTNVAKVLKTKSQSPSSSLIVSIKSKQAPQSSALLIQSKVSPKSEISKSNKKHVQRPLIVSPKLQTTKSNLNNNQKKQKNKKTHTNKQTITVPIKVEQIEKSENEATKSLPFKSGYPSDIDDELVKSQSVKVEPKLPPKLEIKEKEADGSTIKVTLDVDDILRTNLKAINQSTIESTPVSHSRISNNKQVELLGSSHPLRSDLLIRDLYSQVDLLYNELKNFKKMNSREDNQKLNPKSCHIKTPQPNTSPTIK